MRGSAIRAGGAPEVVQNRPYRADDPNLTKLRGDLAKDNPGQHPVDKIVSALIPCVVGTRAFSGKVRERHRRVLR